ncbi:F-box/LRR-repeat protein At2g42730-like [Eucalyptus grandis]|uniref:F-box/LRR-repeat protein At2g42730-like n=1 Tax=Eucalyptus grandis TaxID=71139 RepID=UPI00192E9D97|nr:F-box/LRR-repeat protein At2g42730-like [Eucalyptus grandis]
MDSPSPKRPRSESKAESDDKDRISCLPEQVIDRILSLLTSREAQATCVLSRRWRHLYNSLLTDLDFDWLDLLEKLKLLDNPEWAEKERARYVEWVEKERARYVEWVDNFVHRQSGKEHSLRRFTSKIHVTFALAKQVKVLELHFMPACYNDINPDCDPSRLPYVLEREILMDADVGCSRRASGLGNFGLSPSISWRVGCRYLEQLSLFRVNVEAELIEQLLAACPVLEKLVLEYARGLRWLRVSGESLKLKYLCTRVCKDLRFIEIYDTNLVSFTYRGYEQQILWYLDNVPRLSEVSIEGFCATRVDLIMSELSRYSSLQTMKLYFAMPFPVRALTDLS